MQFSRFILTGVAIMAAPLLWAGDAATDGPPEAARAAQVVFLGEQHDNPAHHAVQAAWVAGLQPKALVFEMLTPEQAAAGAGVDRSDAAALGAAFGWAEAGWPDFAMYHPIFSAAPEAEIVGAGVTRDAMRGLMERDLAEVAGPELARFGLDRPLPPEEEGKRLSLQRAAHCDALPEDMLPRMIGVQRLRDAALANAALLALERTGGPVAVITGNGHARTDWGAPALLRRAAPGVAIHVLGQGEAGQAPEGGFDQVLDAAPVDRGDPCAAFR